MPNTRRAVATPLARTDGGESAVSASFLVREEGDQRLQLGRAEHLPERPGHRSRKLLVTLRRVAVRHENLLTDRRRAAAAPDVIPRRTDRATLSIELVAADAPLLGIQDNRIERRAHRRASGCRRGRAARFWRRGSTDVISGDVDLAAL